MARSTLTADDLYGTTITDEAGQKIGKVEDVYLDDASGAPEWVSVKTGLFGSNISLLPLSEVDVTEGTLVVPFSKDKVKEAPNHDPGQQLSRDDEEELYRYYGMDLGTSGTSADQRSQGTIGSGQVERDTTTADTRTANDTNRDATAASDAGTSAAGIATAGDLAGADRDFGTANSGRDDRATADADLDGRAGFTGGAQAAATTTGAGAADAMTRSKEELHVSTEAHEAGRARLRKHITTEAVSREVPVSHEEATLTREPITDANRDAAFAGGDLTEDEHEIMLNEERAVVNKETVPVERVKLGTETVTGTETISADLREEQIDLDGSAERFDTDRDKA